MSDDMNCDQPLDPLPVTVDGSIVEWVRIGDVVRVGEYTVVVTDCQAGRALVSVRRGKKTIDFGRVRK